MRNSTEHTVRLESHIRAYVGRVWRDENDIEISFDETGGETVRISGVKGDLFWQAVAYALKAEIAKPEPLQAVADLASDLKVILDKQAAEKAAA